MSPNRALDLPFCTFFCNNFKGAPIITTKTLYHVFHPGSTLSHLARHRARRDPQTWHLDLLLLPTHVMFKDIVIKISVTFVPSSHSQTCNIIYIFINIQKNTNIISRKPRTLLLSTYLKIIHLDLLHTHQLAKMLGKHHKQHHQHCFHHCHLRQHHYYH